MGKLPEKINSLICSHNYVDEFKGRRCVQYIINDGEDNQTNIRFELPAKYFRLEKSDIIIDDSNEFVNGFKVVQTKNGEYAYVREVDNVLLPYRYDIASSFNEYGFAMVGKGGRVSWIDKDFRYLNLIGNMQVDGLHDSYPGFDGWAGVSDFSKGYIPLSRVYYSMGEYNHIAYFGIDGKLKSFYLYNVDDEEIDPLSSIEVFIGGSTFDENGYAVANDGDILFAKGYYVSKYDLVKLLKKKGYMDSIRENIDSNYDKTMQKVLKK